MICPSSGDGVAAAARRGHIDRARLCTLAVALLMLVSPVVTFAFTEASLPERATNAAGQSWPAIVMFGCFFWSRSKPLAALSVASALLAVVVGTNLMLSAEGVPAMVGAAVAIVVLAVLLRGANAARLQRPGRT